MTRTMLTLAACFAFSCLAWSAAVASEAPPQPPTTTAAAAGEVPRGATARCVDGTWSSSAQRRGTCSGHGGLETWFGKPPKKATGRCKDGTYTKSASTQGACSGHGGVAFWLEKTRPKP